MYRNYMDKLFVSHRISLMANSSALDLTYPLRAAARLTGLTPELLRAWERRYGVVEPIRTPGGTRRYRAEDLERLRLVKAAVDAGHRIGQVARLGLAELRERAARSPAPSAGRLEEVLSALDRLDGVEAQRLLSLQLSALGPVHFARDFACPLVQEIGDRWASDRLGIAAEHLATGVLRSMLGSALRPSAASRLGPTVVFATPTGERHELGLQMAAVTALGAGACPIYLGAELPVEELVAAVETTGASALALSLVTISEARATRAIGAVRSLLPSQVRVWLGGAGGREVEHLEGVERIGSLEALEQRVALLCFEAQNRR
jgi:DNA-binding transcriptional MerR regulator